MRPVGVARIEAPVEDLEAGGRGEVLDLLLARAVVEADVDGEEVGRASSLTARKRAPKPSEE